MVTGFNTDVPHNGKVYHVQTEDRGLKNPIVESLVYVGGEILLSRKTPYDELVETGRANDDVLAKRMEIQHKGLIAEIRSGAFDPDDNSMPFGHAIITNRSFDEVVRLFLEHEIELEEIRLDLADALDLREGQPATMRLQVVEGDEARPVRGANVVVRLVATGARPLELFSAPTNAQGWVEAAIEIPRSPKGNAAIVCQAVDAGRTAEYTQLVQKKAAGSVDA